jgi:glutaredoxin
MALKNQIKHVAGKDVGEIVLYALSTCQWCKKTKELLNKLKLRYDYIDVNLLNKADEHELNELFKHMNLDMNFPVIVVNDKNVIVGYQEDKIRKLSK